MTTDERTFEQAVLGGAPLTGLVTAATAIVNAGSTTPMRELLLGQLDMLLGATFGQGAQRVLNRLAAGLSPL